MVLVAYRHGLRAAGLVTLRWDAIDFAHGRLHVRRLKGDSSRFIHCPAGSAGSVIWLAPTSRTREVSANAAR